MARLADDRTLGSVQFEEKECKVLNRPLPEFLTNKYLQYLKQPHTVLKTSWMLHKCKWKIEKDKLYLTEMFQTQLLKKFVEKEKILATWVDKLLLHRATEIIISSKSILKKENIYYTELHFQDAKLLSKKPKVSTKYVREVGNKYLLGHMPLGVFTFDREDIFFTDENLHIKGDDTLIPFLEKEINAMVKKNNKGGIDLNSVDMRKVLKKTSKVTYLCDVVSTTEHMNADIHRMLDRINIIRDELPANCLVHIDTEVGFNTEVVKEFMECMYDMCDDSYIFIGCNERKKRKISKKKEDVFYEVDEMKPYMVLKVLMGVC